MSSVAHCHICQELVNDINTHVRHRHTEYTPHKCRLCGKGCETIFRAKLHHRCLHMCLRNGILENQSGEWIYVCLFVHCFVLIIVSCVTCTIACILVFQPEFKPDPSLERSTNLHVILSHHPDEDETDAIQRLDTYQGPDSYQPLLDQRQPRELSMEEEYPPIGGDLEPIWEQQLIQQYKQQILSVGRQISTSTSNSTSSVSMQVCSIIY